MERAKDIDVRWLTRAQQCETMAGAGSSAPVRHAFRVEIRNDSDQPVQVVGRKWFIEAGGGVRVIEGRGLLGESPVIDSGHSLTYAGSHDAPAGATLMATFFFAKGEGEIVYASLE